MCKTMVILAPYWKSIWRPPGVAIFLGLFFFMIYIYYRTLVPSVMLSSKTARSRCLAAPLMHLRTSATENVPGTAICISILISANHHVFEMHLALSESAQFLLLSEKNQNYRKIEATRSRKNKLVPASKNINLYYTDRAVLFHEIVAALCPQMAEGLFFSMHSPAVT